MNSLASHRRGRPLAFLVILALGWTCMRLAVVSLWPAADDYGVMVPQSVALEDSQSGPVPKGAKPLAPKAPPSSRDSVDTVEEKASVDELVEDLEPAPPAHLETQPVPMESAAALNALWMAASRIENESGGASTDKQGAADQPW